jgi:DNA-binding CsgD family transcriptional regulator
MLDKFVLDYIDAVKGSHDLEKLHQITEAYVNKLGFGIYAYIGFPPQAEAFTVNNHPAHWLDRYRDQKYLQVDPVVLDGVAVRRPFTWTDIQERSKGQVAQLMDEALDVGIVSGATIPVHAAGQEFGLFFVSSEMPRPEFEKFWREREPLVQLAALNFHSTVFEGLNTKEFTSQVKLTARERECLLWAARGKTAWETSQVLSLAQRTVVFHLCNAMKKLGAASTQQALVKAVRMGIVAP